MTEAAEGRNPDAVGSSLFPPVSKPVFPASGHYFFDALYTKQRRALHGTMTFGVIDTFFGQDFQSRQQAGSFFTHAAALSTQK